MRHEYSEYDERSQRPVMPDDASQGQIRADRQPDEGLSTADIASGAARTRADDETAVGRPARSAADETEPLFPQSDLQEYRARWNDVQTGFVDEPRRAVERAGQLVAEVMKRLAEEFARERTSLEEQWDQGTTSRRRTSGKHCAAIVRSSIACFQSEQPTVVLLSSCGVSRRISQFPTAIR